MPADRARFYENFVLAVVESGRVVSWQWFKHRDAGETGSNKGVVGVDYLPYTGFAAEFARVNREVYSLAAWADQAIGASENIRR